jgi:hypothetical protein
MATHEEIGLSQPAASTITHKLDAISLNKNSTTVLREVLVLGSPETSNALAAVLNSAPLSTAFALAVRPPVVSAHHFTSTNTANPALVKSSSGVFCGFSAFNASSVAVYLKLHNSSAAPTAGSSVVHTFGIQAGTHVSVSVPGGGLRFTEGIGRTLVRDLPDTGVTATAGGDAVVEIFYE